MMKTNYKTIVEAAPALSKVSKLDLKVQEAVKLSRLLGEIEPEIKTYDKIRLKLCEKFGKKNDSGVFEFSDETKVDFKKEFDELLNTEVKISSPKVKITSDIKIDASSVFLLSSFVEFKGE